jgi:hypothetical protein
MAYYLKKTPCQFDQHLSSYKVQNFIRSTNGWVPQFFSCLFFGRRRYHLCANFHVSGYSEIRIINPAYMHNLRY